MIVVENRILHPGRNDITNELAFPDSLGHPHAGNLRIELFVEPNSILGDLAHPISTGEHREDRFIERSADDFDSAGCD